MPALVSRSFVGDGGEILLQLTAPLASIPGREEKGAAICYMIFYAVKWKAYSLCEVISVTAALILIHNYILARLGVTAVAVITPHNG